MRDYTGTRQSGMTDENPVFRSLGVIEERIREKLTVKSLADSVHFSQYHYQRLFREAVGDSVMVRIRAMAHRADNFFIIVHSLSH